MFWIVIILVYILVYAVEFVLHAVPYIRAVCQRYRFNCFAAGMNFLFIKMAFDTGVSFLYLNMSNTDELVSAVITATFGSILLVYMGYLGYHVGMYSKELAMEEKDSDVKSVRAQHIFSEYDPSSAACYSYLIVQQVKKTMFVAIALLMYDIYCYGLALSALISYGSMMYFSFARPFREPIDNLTILYEEVLTLFCFIVLFRFASEDSIDSEETARSTAQLFSLLVFLLTVIPAGLALFALLLSLRYFGKVCNWKRDYQEQQDTFDSREESDEHSSKDDLFK